MKVADQASGTPIARDVNFELGRLYWTQFYVYFPIPEDGLHGKEFNLLIDTKQTEETFVVRFAVK